jgi:hypothetical protein
MIVKRNVHSSELLYQATEIVSPNVFGEERKDQDRARFFEPGLIGVVCDGVSSSPRSSAGAELVASCAPILFARDTHEGLRMVCDLLMAHRHEFQATDLAVSDDVPEAMQAMLRNVLREKQATSYQTTVAAVRLRPGRSDVGAKIVRCGDSAVFAFWDDGELLYSSLAQPPQHESTHRPASTSDGWQFGPGDQILVRVEGPLDGHTTVVENGGIQERHRKNWLVCTAVEACSDVEQDGCARPGAVVIARGDRLLVPKYLYGQLLMSGCRKYRCLDYSSTIRIMPASPPRVPSDGIEHRGSVTAVLPDHFYSGQYDYIQDRFPCGTHFVLGSDGFYSAFATASHMWAWLQENRSALAVPQEREAKLRDLHQQLHEKGTDDDMSCVWMYPVAAGATAGAAAAGEQEE